MIRNATPTGRGNSDAVRRDADAIAARYLAGEISIKALMRGYRVGYEVIMDVLRPRTTAEQRTAINDARRRSNAGPGRFCPGQVPWNKGISCCRHSPGTEFRPGQIRGAAARQYRAIGTLSIRTSHGTPCRYIKVREGGRPQDRCVPYARWLWEQEHGPIARGWLVIHIDGDSLNDDLGNLRLVDRRTHLAVQKARDPEMEVRRRSASSAAQRLRHQRNLERKEREGPARQALVGPSLIRWQCPGCGHHADGKRPPARCPKCGGSSFERLKLRKTEGQP